MAVALWSQMQKRKRIQKSDKLGESSLASLRQEFWTADESTMSQLTFVLLVVMHKESQ
jgi:hypothetical protein